MGEYLFEHYPASIPKIILIKADVSACKTPSTSGLLIVDGPSLRTGLEANIRLSSEIPDTQD